MQGPIVVGVDGSPASHEALRWALAEARRCDTSLKVVSAWMLPWGLGLGVQFPDSLPADLQRVAEQLVASMVQNLGAETRDIRIEQVVAEGEPAHVLLQAAKDAQLLVVGSRGLGGFRELMLGSVSQQCAHHASCPVVIVRGVGPEEHEASDTHPRAASHQGSSS
jgi:nucleotide-binding universal stress UspA family protein